MESLSVEELVDGLIASFETGLQFYSQWQRRRVKENHYRKPGSASKPATNTSALGTSFNISSRIKETYDVGFAIIGSDFAAGDAKARQVISGQLVQMRAQTNVLRTAMTSTPGPLDINVILQASETARISSIQALAELYQRLAIGRPVPREIPVPKWRSSSRENTETPRPRMPPPPPPPEDDAITMWSATSGPPVFQSEPPSPPLTPKTGLEEQRTPDGAAALDLVVARPSNSVFSIFCGEAMSLQVNVKRPVPERRQCKCGFRWRVPELPEAGGRDANGALALKDGFTLTRRFLAKSHCEGRGSGYGCVLCTSCGKTETYATAELLAAHVNGCHSKWQMLHDRDLA